MDLHSEFENSRFFNSARMDRRSADALAGLAAGITADGVVSLEEAQFLQRWLEANVAHLEDPVVNLLYQRLDLMLRDGVLDADESADLLHILRRFGGMELAKTQPELRYSAPNDLPFNHPVPEIMCEGRLFVFTGTMAYGPRKACQLLVEERGGLIGGSVNKKTDFLIVGSIGNEQWRHSSYGLKIMRAVELRDSGASLAILGEEHWAKAVLG